MKSGFTIEEEDDLCAAFWATQTELTQLKHGERRQNDCPCDVRVAWCEFVDQMYRDGVISDELANSATLNGW